MQGRPETLTFALRANDGALLSAPVLVDVTINPGRLLVPRGRQLRLPRDHRFVGLLADDVGARSR